MALIENTLFGEIDRVEVAIDRLKTFVPPEGYWVGNSGGKDSTVICDLVEKSGVKAKYFHSLTTLDAPELIWHIRKNMKHTKIIQPAVPLLQYMVKKGKIPPSRFVRWCCEKYKECNGFGHFVVTGVRFAESNKRAKRKVVESCFKRKNTMYLHPIIDWSDEDVWEYIKSRNLAYCCLYDEGFSRLGCVLCPLAAQENRIKEMNRWPKIKESWRRAIYKSYANNKNGFKRWRTADELWGWWINGGSVLENPDQTVLFE